MPTTPIEKILIIGSGPVRIGQSAAYDGVACRACHLFRQAGRETIMVHCDPSALAADAETADRTFLVPLTVAALTEIILREKPDAILPTVGGATALALAKSLMENGLLKASKTRLLCVSETTLSLVNDPGCFSEAVQRLGFDMVSGHSARDISDATAFAESMGYPVFARSFFADGHRRHGIVYNVEELRQILTEGRPPMETKGTFRIEKALAGYRQFELELLRDSDNHTRVVGMIECIDPVGVHSTDAICVMPPLTIDEKTRRQMEEAACKLAEHACVTGIMSVKFAVAPQTQAVLILSMNPRYSPLTAFCARTSGVDLSAILARLAMGTSIEEACKKSGLSPTGPAAVDTIGVRLPRWEFERFFGETPRLDVRVRSTGAAMGIGRTFLEALQKASRARSPQNPLLGLGTTGETLSTDSLMRKLVVPSPQRLDEMVELLKRDVAPEELAQATGIDVRWIRQLADLARLCVQLSSGSDQRPSSSKMESAVTTGFSAPELSHLLSMEKEAANLLLSETEVSVTPHSPGDNTAPSVWFNTTTKAVSQHAPLSKTVIIVGPGPGRIGQGLELDHCLVHASNALRAAGRHVVLVNNNPDSACGIDAANRTYVEPITIDDIKRICRFEKPEGVILQFGGYDAMDLGAELIEAGIRVLGTHHSQVQKSQNRIRFSRLLTELGIPHPQMGTADTPEKALDLAESIGYPLVARPRLDWHGKGQTIVMDARTMERHVKNASVSPESPIFIEQFLEYAIEVEADALCDGQRVYVPAVMEHIELAGVHSGDAAMVIPPYSTPPRHVETIARYIHKIALEMEVKGVINARFAVFNDTVYLLTVRPWACRTLPMISKICDVPMAQRAVETMLGVTLEEMDLSRRILPHYGIRSPVFPFDTFSKTDPLLGLRMRSNGQTLVLSGGFGMAYFTSQEAAGPALPLSGNVLITVTDADKPSILEPARLFTELGFTIHATRGTYLFLQKNGIDAKLVKKLGFGRPDLVDGIKTGEVALVINTPSGRQSQQDDAHIRNTAIRYNIPNITTPAGALAAAKGIAARKQGQDALVTLQSYARAIR